MNKTGKKERKSFPAKNNKLTISREKESWVSCKQLQLVSTTICNPNMIVQGIIVTKDKILQGGHGIKKSLDELAATCLRYDYDDPPRLVSFTWISCSVVPMMLCYPWRLDMMLCNPS